MRKISYKEFATLLTRIIIIVSFYSLFLFWVDPIIILIIRPLHLSGYYAQSMVAIRTPPRVLGLFLVLLLAKKWDKARVFELGLSFKTGWVSLFVKGFAIGFLGLSILILMYSLLFHAKFISNQDFITALTLFGTGLLITLVQALSEEVLFRGYILRSLISKLNENWGIFLSSVIFAVYHLFAGNFTLSVFLSMFIFGVFTALYKIKIDKGSLLGVWGFHAAWNFTQEFVYRTPFLSSRIENTTGIFLLLCILIVWVLTRAGMFGKLGLSKP